LPVQGGELAAAMMFIALQPSDSVGDRSIASAFHVDS
jgi:hypothetical protein